MARPKNCGRRAAAGWPTSRWRPTTSRRPRRWPVGAGGPSGPATAPPRGSGQRGLALAVGLVVVDRERHQTDLARRAAEEALALERVSFRQALKAGDDYFTAMSSSRLLLEPGQQPLRRELLQHGLAYYQEFLTHRG